ncbi:MULTISPECIES: acetylxylan esterase [unclassified Streptococcus]|uniref:acetylxylan esterase n=1 Tax=unclassified Streptococcus TaxID=2608887 RepID=UPI001072892F|nr:MULTISPECIES: acetylxylan esterase [unclassified Streptococcus]MBF0787106.1 acetylxylan esterase [Streptococcus sp. 19428wC2_LYSM12]MCQ9211338.1 acetylxylan esterase [Streptococcus sp. B01]MCQ9214650.1 acetylxylan esterase [Streptococcus sp. O1]TFV05990.1 acetylxylan esterase [Streptococcus sp. LYSM12]
MNGSGLLEEIKTYRGRDEVPVDFDDFWDQAIADLELPVVYRLVEKDFGLPSVDCYEIQFDGTNGGKVYARMVLPRKSEKVPMVFHFHGYMGRGLDWPDMLAYTTAGYGMVSMDVRGQSGYSLDGARNVRGNTVKGQILRGVVDGPDHLFYKDIYLDVYTLIELVAGLERVDEARLSSYGGSQGGALALVAAALNPRITNTVAIYPFLCDFRRVLEIGNTSEAYDEIFRYFKFHDPFHETKEEVFATLAYIDVKNFAHRIKSSVKMITGLNDTVCYPVTQFAMYNRLECEKEYHLLPEYGHEGMFVYVNNKVFNWLCGTRFESKSLFAECK